MTIKGQFVFFLMFLLIIQGCASRSDFTALSSKNVNLSNIQIDPSTLKGRAFGEDCTYIVLFFPTGGPPSLEEAVDRALEAKGSNILLDAVVSWHSFYIPLIYGQHCWKAEGEAYDTYE